MVNRRWYTRLALAVVAVFAFSTACDDDPADPGGGGEQELITRVILSLTPVGGGAAISATIDDPDGAGPQPPDPPTQTLTVTAGTTYNGAIQFLDASDPSDIEDITLEVEEEGDAHRVFYTVAGVTDVTIPLASLDLDDNGAPLGITFQVVAGAGASGTGTIRVVLSHYDEEPKGDGMTPSDETDIDVTFDIEVS